MHGLTQQPIVRRGRESHRGVVGVLETWRFLDFRHKAIGELAHAAELPPLEDDQIPRHD